MANIVITEAEFEAVATAAWDAQDDGDHARAAVLDKLARKINASLSRTKRAPWETGSAFSWKDVDSVLEIRNSDPQQ